MGMFNSRDSAGSGGGALMHWRLKSCFVLALAMGVWAQCYSQERIQDAGDLLDNARESSAARSIPLSSILTTSRQPGMIAVEREFQLQDNVDNKSTRGYLRQILEASHGGASNVFLVDAANASAAIDASYNVIVGSRSAETAVTENIPNPRHGRLWIVVYLGSGPSSPVWWTIENVTVDGFKVAVNYRQSKPSPATDDVCQYYYWIPLSELTTGMYEVELFDTEATKAVLMRRIEFTATSE